MRYNDAESRVDGTDNRTTDAQPYHSQRQVQVPSWKRPFSGPAKIKSWRLRLRIDP